jgi:hypothetical protein
LSTTQQQQQQKQKQKQKHKPKYSGPNRSGICKCGHTWDAHHLGIVANTEYYEETGEPYFPQECEYFGFNELGGLQPSKDKDGQEQWVDHCFSYIDKLDNSNDEIK